MRHHLQIVVLFLVIFAVTDLCCLIPCCGETGTAGRSHSEAGTDSGEWSAASSGPCAEYPGADSDCFCGGHVLPARPTCLPTAAIRRLFRPAQPGNVPTAPSQSLFHPPRTL